jgi:hypothetical protein
MSPATLAWWPSGLVLAPDLLASLAQVWCSHLLLAYLLERPALRAAEGRDARPFPWRTLLAGFLLFVIPGTLLLYRPGLAALGAMMGLGLWRLLAARLEHRARRLAPEQALALHLLYGAAFVILAMALLKQLGLPGCGCSDRLPLLAWGAGALLLLPAGDQLVRDLLDGVRVPPRAESGEEGHQARVGRLIGWLERLLICGFALAGQFAAVGFVLAAKSMARFKALDDREFAEQYVLGTLLSTLIALGTAMLLTAWLTPGP